MSLDWINNLSHFDLVIVVRPVINVCFPLTFLFVWSLLPAWSLRVHVLCANLACAACLSVGCSFGLVVYIGLHVSVSVAQHQQQEFIAHYHHDHLPLQQLYDAQTGPGSGTQSAHREPRVLDSGEAAGEWDRNMSRGKCSTVSSFPLSLFKFCSYAMTPLFLYAATSKGWKEQKEKGGPKLFGSAENGINCRLGTVGQKKETKFELQVCESFWGLFPWYLWLPKGGQVAVGFCKNSGRTMFCSRIPFFLTFCFWLETREWELPFSKIDVAPLQLVTVLVSLFIHVRRHAYGILQRLIFLGM